MPAHVDTCRCGQPRRAAASTAPVGPPRSSPAPERGEGFSQSTLARGAGAAVLAVAVYFGSRACNRETASRDARREAEQALTTVLGAEGAQGAMSRHHRACFDATYSTGWGRRQAAKFDAEKYVGCVMERLQKDPQLAAGRVVARPTPRPAAERPVESGPPRLAILGVRPGPNPDPAYGSYAVLFRVSGGALPPLTFTNEQVICDGKAIWSQPGHHTVSLGQDDDMSRGQVSAFFRKPAGAQSCVFELALANEHMQALTDVQTVPLF